jgi:O-Antigen ligase
MLSNLKALLVVVMLAALAFRLARPLALAYMSEAAFRRRRAIWFGLTIVAFVSPSFWIYAVIALVVLFRETRHEENPLALYALVTFTIPNVGFYVPAPLVNQFFELTQYRLLSLAILLPAIMKRPAAQERAPAGLRIEDLLLAAYLLLQVALLAPYESFTNTMRRTFLFGIDTFIVFYAFSRIADRARLAEVMACFWLSCLVMALLAVFESLKGWLLYTGLAANWGDPNLFAWLYRGGSLRAQAAAGHSLNLGYHMAMGLGLYLYLRSRRVSVATDLVIFAAFGLAAFVSSSRAAWLTTVLVATFFVLMRPNAMRRLLGPIALCAVAIAVVSLTPLHESVLDRLPFIGTVAQDTVEYRERLAETSWLLIRQNPWFGDPFVYLRMESLRQGQGIIDIVNGYLFAALFTGCVGLGLLLSVFAGIVARGLRARLRLRGVDADADAVAMGAALFACLLGTLVFIATAGFGPTTYLLGGLTLSFAWLFSRRRRLAPSEPAVAAEAVPPMTALHA